MTAPRIGISTYREPATWGAWRHTADLLPTNYADSVRTAGGVALLLPPGAADPAAAADAVLDSIDGLVISGGADVDPQRYGEARRPETDEPRRDRDEWEIALIAAALDRRIPLLGVCRGLQVLNVALGGTLVQHLPDLVGTEVHSPHRGSFSRHRVRAAPGSRVATIVGLEADVPTHHHQGIATLAPSLVASAWADDGVVEAAERPGEAWVVAVQWHPEVEGGGALFDAFVAAGVAYREDAALR